MRTISLAVGISSRLLRAATDIHFRAPLTHGFFSAGRRIARCLALHFGIEAGAQ
jgi:hypothetical protein